MADLGFPRGRNVWNHFLKLQKSVHVEEFQESVPNDPNVPDLAVGSTDNMITEQAIQRTEAYARRRTLRSLQRQQFDTARQHGLRARQASRLREASTQEQE